MIVREFAEDAAIKFCTCQKILTENLQKRHVSAIFVPCPLTPEQNDDRVSICTELRERAQNEPNFIYSVNTGDENWVYVYDSET
jgi:hypothetical protein